MEQGKAGATRRWFGRAALAALIVLQGCANTPQSTQVERESALQPGEGIVTLRLVHFGAFRVQSIVVKAEQGEQTYTMRPVQYGQTGSMTFVGKFPAGRYQPLRMHSYWMMTNRTSPLEKLTGKFDVEAGRVTDLGTMIHSSLPGVSPRDDEKLDSATPSGGMSRTMFVLPLDPTPVPTEKLLASRFPALAAAVSGRSKLGWVAGTVPQQKESILQGVRALADEVSPPVMLGSGRVLTAGRAGLVVDRRGGKPQMRATGSVHQIETMLVLRDGRWLVAGEEGYVATSANEGQTWERLAGFAPDEIMLHAAQAPDGTVYLVSSHDNGTTVYATPPAALAFQPVHRLPLTRRIEGGFWTGAAQMDSAGSSKDRLVIYSAPETLNTFDFRTRQWESFKTPRSFNQGLKVTPDGYVVGFFSQMWMYGSLDYGKTWTRLEAWVNMSYPHFVDRNRGYMIAADAGLTGIGEHKMRRTDDGGRTWTAGGKSQALHGWMQPLWLDPDGRTFYTLRGGSLWSSTDEGLSWR